MLFLFFDIVQLLIHLIAIDRLKNIFTTPETDVEKKEPQPKRSGPHHTRSDSRKRHHQRHHRKRNPAAHKQKTEQGTASKDQTKHDKKNKSNPTSHAHKKRPTGKTQNKPPAQNKSKAKAEKSSKQSSKKPAIVIPLDKPSSKNDNSSKRTPPDK